MCIHLFTQRNKEPPILNERITSLFMPSRNDKRLVLVGNSSNSSLILLLHFLQIRLS